MRCAMNRASYDGLVAGPQAPFLGRNTLTPGAPNLGWGDAVGKGICQVIIMNIIKIIKLVSCVLPLRFMKTVRDRFELAFYAMATLFLALTLIAHHH